MENVTLAVLGIIILANVFGILAVLRVGSQHDAHMDVSEPADSWAITRLTTDYKVAEPVERALPASTEPVTE